MLKHLLSVDDLRNVDSELKDWLCVILKEHDLAKEIKVLKDSDDYEENITRIEKAILCSDDEKAIVLCTELSDTSNSKSFTSGVSMLDDMTFDSVSIHNGVIVMSAPGVSRIGMIGHGFLSRLPSLTLIEDCHILTNEYIEKDAALSIFAEKVLCELHVDTMMLACDCDIDSLDRKAMQERVYFKPNIAELRKESKALSRKAQKPWNANKKHPSNVRRGRR